MGDQNGKCEQQDKAHNGHHLLPGMINQDARGTKHNEC